jgi:very-short-patch-repair endonuclease
MRIERVTSVRREGAAARAGGIVAGVARAADTRRTSGFRDADFVVVTAQRRIAALAARQSGVVCRAQLVALGIPARTINHWIAQGRLIPIHRGVYAVGHAALSPRGRSVAALLAVGSGAVLSHEWAAAVWGLILAWPPHPHVTVAGRRLHARPGLTIHWTRAYTPADLRRRDGLPITSPLRTLADIGADERAVAEAQVLKLVTRQELETAGGRLARAVADGGAAPTRSKIERAMLRVVTQAKLPRPLVNHRHGRITPDFLWPEERLAVETDGWGAHGHREAFERDRARDAELLAQGYAVLRFAYRQLTEEPLLVAVRLAPVIAARRTAAPG